MADTNTGWDNQPEQPQDDARQTVPMPPVDQTTSDTSYAEDNNASQPTSAIETNEPTADTGNDANATQQQPTYTQPQKNIPVHAGTGIRGVRSGSDTADATHPDFRSDPTDSLTASTEPVWRILRRILR